MVQGSELSWLRWWIILNIIHFSICANKRPHILFMMVDDMGWNDVSFHGSDQISTPNIDALATLSVVLEQYYSEAICTPARSALLTGKYPMRIGMQGTPLLNSEDRGIPLTEILLPQRLAALGYNTHLVGKWHVGMSKREYLPTSRGYNSHYGIRGGFQDSYTHFKVENWPNGREFSGLDLFDNDIPQDDEDRYIVDVLTEQAISIIQNHNASNPLFLHLAHNAPHAGNEGGLLQPPLNSTVESRHIANSNRRLYAEIVRHIDKCIAKVIRALSDKEMLQDTIIVFVSDNGAPTVGMFNNWGVNLPFRGTKDTPWEGAVRVPAFIWHSSLRPKVLKSIMHITDWMPTLLAAVGGEVNTEIDGINQWDSIANDEESPRKDVLISVYESQRNVYAAYRVGDYKIVVGNVSGLNNGYYGTEFLINKDPPPDYFTALKSSEVAKVFEKFGKQFDYDEVLAMRKACVIRQIDKVRDLIPCEPTPARGCLYNVRQDPSESHNLWGRGSRIDRLLTSRLRTLWATQLRRGPTALDARADPANFGYRWQPWLNDTVVNNNETSTTTESFIDEKFKDDNAVLVSNNRSIVLSDRTVASMTGCERSTGFRNILCIFRSVF